MTCYHKTIVACENLT